MNTSSHTLKAHCRKEYGWSDIYAILNCEVKAGLSSYGLAPLRAGPQPQPDHHRGCTVSWHQQSLGSLSSCRPLITMASEMASSRLPARLPARKDIPPESSPSPALLGSSLIGLDQSPLLSSGEGVSLGVATTALLPFVLPSACRVLMWVVATGDGHSGECSADSSSHSAISFSMVLPAVPHQPLPTQLFDRIR